MPEVEDVTDAPPEDGAIVPASDAAAAEDPAPGSLVLLLRLMRAEFVQHAEAGLPGRPLPPPTILYDEGDLTVPTDGPPMGTKEHLDSAKILYMNMGMAIFEGAVPAALLELCRPAASQAVQRVRTALVERGHGPFEEQDWAFNSVVRSGYGRLDVRGIGHGVAPLNDPRLHDRAPWLPFVRESLGPFAVEVHRGLIVNYPGSELQRWRADGPPSETKPPERNSAEVSEAGSADDWVFPRSTSMTIHLPLCALEARGGGAEHYLPASHMPMRAGLYEQLEADEPETAPMPYAEPMPPVGSAIAVDERIFHRGTPNERHAPPPADVDAAAQHCGERVCLYITYADSAAEARRIRARSAANSSWPRAPEPLFPADQPLFPEDEKAAAEMYAAADAEAEAAAAKAEEEAEAKAKAAEQQEQQQQQPNGDASTEGGEAAAAAADGDSEAVPMDLCDPSEDKAASERIMEERSDGTGAEAEWRLSASQMREEALAQSREQQAAERAEEEKAVAALPPKETWLVSKAHAAAVKLGLIGESDGDAALLALKASEIERAASRSRKRLPEEEVEQLAAILHTYLAAMVIDRSDPLAQPRLVTEGVFLAPHSVARDLPALRELGITGIVSLTAECGPQFPEHFEYHYEPLMAEGATTIEHLKAALPRCVGFIMLHLAASPQNFVLVHDVHGKTRAAAVVAVAMAVRSQCSVRAAYGEMRSRREGVFVPETMLEALEPVAEEILHRFYHNKRLLSQRGLLGLDHERLLR